MKLDTTIQHILDVINREVNDEMDIDLDDDTVLDIINSQFSGIAGYTKDKKVVKLDYFGKFKIADGREDYVTKGRLKNIMVYLGNIEILPDYRYVIEDREEVDYHSIVKFVDSQLKSKIGIATIVDKIKVVIDGVNTPLKHLTND